MFVRVHVMLVPMLHIYFCLCTHPGRLVAFALLTHHTSLNIHAEVNVCHRVFFFSGVNENVLFFLFFSKMKP